MIQKLSKVTDITEVRSFGKEVITQRMEIEVSYNPQDDSFECENVFITQGNIRMEVSKLLHKAEGNPLETTLSAINWREISLDKKEMTSESLFDKLGNIAKQDALNRFKINL